METTDPERAGGASLYSLFSTVKSGLKDIFLKSVAKAKEEEISINPGELRIWMIGHSTVLINLFGTTILTDPVLSNWLPFPRRLVTAAYNAAKLPPIDYLLISHAHLDHFHSKSIRQLASKTNVIILPKNCSDLISDMNYRQTLEIGWEEKIEFSDLTLHSFKPKHWGKRYPWEKINRGYNSYLIKKNGFGIFFAGDSAYDEIFKKIGVTHQVDIAILPIGSYFPHSSHRSHMNPADALQTFSDLKAKQFIPIHWGNFRLSLEPISEPPRLLTKLAKQSGNMDKIHILHNGESYKFKEKN